MTRSPRLTLGGAQLVKSWIQCALLLAVVSALTSCSNHPPPYRLFPVAVKVHVYGAPSSDLMDVDKSGHVSAQGSAGNIPVTDGGWLTPSEIAELRDSIHFTRTPDSVAACCIPRHAFLFYDATGHYLGYLDVCFECGCADIFPQPPRNGQLNWIDWNRQVIGKIVEDHHLGPLEPAGG